MLPTKKRSLRIITAKPLQSKHSTTPVSSQCSLSSVSTATSSIKPPNLRSSLGLDLPLPFSPPRQIGQPNSSSDLFLLAQALISSQQVFIRSPLISPPQQPKQQPKSEQQQQQQSQLHQLSPPQPQPQQQLEVKQEVKQKEREKRNRSSRTKKPFSSETSSTPPATFTSAPACCAAFNTRGQPCARPVTLTTGAGSGDTHSVFYCKYHEEFYRREEGVRLASREDFDYDVDVNVDSLLDFSPATATATTTRKRKKVDLSIPDSPPKSKPRVRTKQESTAAAAKPPTPTPTPPPPPTPPPTTITSSRARSKPSLKKKEQLAEQEALNLSLLRVKSKALYACYDSRAINVYPADMGAASSISSDGKWFCGSCGLDHWILTRKALEPFRPVHGFRFERVSQDGDCFYQCIILALRGLLQGGKGKGKKNTSTQVYCPSVKQMRRLVAEAVGEDQLNFYKLQAEANPEEKWLDFVRGAKEGRGRRHALSLTPSDNDKEDGDYSESSVDTPIKVASNSNSNSNGDGDGNSFSNRNSRNGYRNRKTATNNNLSKTVDDPQVSTLEELKTFIKLTGSEMGNDRCLWGDDFAFQVIAEELRLCILLIDMERTRDAWPYRMLAKCAEAPPLRYIVLQRESIGHFVPLIWTGAKHNNYKGGENKGVGAFTFQGQAGVDYPEAVKVLWGLEAIEDECQTGVFGGLYTGRGAGLSQSSK